MYRLSAESITSKLAVQGPLYAENRGLLGQALSRFSYGLGNDRHLHKVSTMYTWMTWGKPPADATPNTAIRRPHLQKAVGQWLSLFLVKLVPMLQLQTWDHLDCDTILNTWDRYPLWRAWASLKSKVHTCRHGCERHLDTIGTGNAYTDVHLVAHKLQWLYLCSRHTSSTVQLCSSVQQKEDSELYMLTHYAQNKVVFVSSLTRGIRPVSTYIVCSWRL